MLECVTHTARPLRLNELSSAIEFAFPTVAFAGGYKSLTRIACAPLLEVLEDETVQVIHHSFTEYLLDLERNSTSKCRQFPVLSSWEAHKKLACISLRYLMSGTLGTGTTGVIDDGYKKSKRRSINEDDDENDADTTALNEVKKFNYQEAHLRNHFLDYAVRNWTYHASDNDFDDQEFRGILDEFLDPCRNDFCRWLDLEWGRNTVLYHRQRQAYQRMARSLHIAAFAGLASHVETLLAEQDVDVLDSDNRTPLHWYVSSF